MGFATDCTLVLGGQLGRGCDTRPLYATPYFNSSTYLNATNYYEASGDYSGYVGTGYMFNTATCLSTTSSTSKFFCNLQN